MKRLLTIPAALVGLLLMPSDEMQFPLGQCDPVFHPVRTIGWQQGDCPTPEFRYNNFGNTPWRHPNYSYPTLSI